GKNSRQGRKIVRTAADIAVETRSGPTQSVLTNGAFIKMERRIVGKSGFHHAAIRYALPGAT
ncbi:MAG TPA: hypothetical protein PKL15_04980, partial [Saprospiraceae bacterium]|nr:hypothetical protein [Saprospiraceae bacterium]